MTGTGPFGRARRARAFSFPRAAAWVLLCATAGVAALEPADFHRAVRVADAAAVEAWLASGAQVDVPDRDGRTALQVAVRYGHTALVRRLLAAGSRVDAPDADGWTAVHHAAQAGDATLLEALIAAGGQVNLIDGYRYAPLHLAAREGHERACLVLLEAGADPRARIDVGMTAADLASDRFPELSRLLRSRETR